MNIHLPAILMFTRGTRFWHTAIYMIPTLAMNRSRNRAGTDEMASLIQEDETMSPCFEGMTSTEAPDVDREVGPMWHRNGHRKMGKISRKWWYIFIGHVVWKPYFEPWEVWNMMNPNIFLRGLLMSIFLGSRFGNPLIHHPKAASPRSQDHFPHQQNV